MQSEEMRRLIEKGDVEGVRRALELNPALANEPIFWVLNQSNTSDPLHYLSDCVGQGWLTDAKASDIARVLLAHGALIEGNENRESPLIASVSLGAESVSQLLVEAGAALERTSVFGARALHWAAWMGSLSTVKCLVVHGSAIEARCSKFGATPLFWAVHGYGPKGPMPKKDQIGAAKILIEAGATINSANNEGLSAMELSQQCAGRDMFELLRKHMTQASRIRTP
ncbi:MAG: ankyrin repeat domain-containing protein [Dokdonella sp.]